MLYTDFRLSLSLAGCTLRLPEDHSTPYLENMPLEYNDDLTMMGNNHSRGWDALDMDPQFSTFNSTDFAFDTSAFGLQNEQTTHSSSTSTDRGFNQHFPTFNSPNFSFDTPSAFNFEQFSQVHPSSNLMDFSSIIPNNNLSFSVPSMVAPTLVNASQPSQFSGASSFMQIQPTIARAPVNASPSNASPTVVPNNASPHPTTAPVSPVSPATAPSDVSSPPPVQNEASPQHAAAIVQPVHTSAKNGITPLSSNSPLSQIAENPETSALSSDSDRSLSVPLNQADGITPLSSNSPLSQIAENPETSTFSDGRRSGRNPVPSKRHEQMNQIDGKAKNKTDHIEKENVPSTTPKWTIDSRDHLLKSDLGKNWSACVQAWFELEQDLGYGSQPGAKVRLWIYFFS
jgi:hypothetical protein